jgi:hypothetical protein
MKRSLVAILMAAVTTLSLLASGTVANAEQPPGTVPSSSDPFAIAEVGVLGHGGVFDQFIKITNTTGQPQDLGQARLLYASGGSAPFDLVMFPEGATVEPYGSYLLASVGYTGGVADQFFSHQLTPPFVLTLLSETGPNASAYIPGWCPRAVYIPGIAGAPYVCSPLSEAGKVSQR